MDVSKSAANVVGAKLAGVDIIADDITVAPTDAEFFINEVNTTPCLISPNYDVERHTSAIVCAEKLLRHTLGA